MVSIDTKDAIRNFLFGIIVREDSDAFLNFESDEYEENNCNYYLVYYLHANVCIGFVSLSVCDYSSFYWSYTY